MSLTQEPSLIPISGQPSWPIASSTLEAYVTQLGGHIGPITYDLGSVKISPHDLAPWAEEATDPDLANMLKVLRGDFFCLPFGGNETPYGTELHPPHGETANNEWKFEALEEAGGEHSLHLRLETEIRKGRVDKWIRLVDGHAAVYSQHVISGMEGSMSVGHHAMLRFPNRPQSGVISTSPFVYGQVYPELMELPEKRGYSYLKPGAEFSSLEAVPTQMGATTDLSHYPSRRGYEDLVMMVSDPDLPFAWTAAAFPQEHFVWFALKDPRVLHESIFWLSNGGRHYAPWSGRHVNVIGFEEVTANFHPGIAESVGANPISDKGYPTSIALHPDRPFVVNYIMAAAAIPEGFDRVESIHIENEGSSVLLTATSGQAVSVPLDPGFLWAAPSPIPTILSKID